jgi:hypothetical protein
MYLTHVLHDGSAWLMLACLMVFVGVVIGLFTEAGSGIASHPFTRPGLGGGMGDLPPEATGRAEIESMLWGHPRPPRRARRSR